MHIEKTLCSKRLLPSDATKKNPYEIMSESKERIIKRIGELSILLGGEMKQMTRVNSMGRSSKVIEIEYEINERNH